MQRSLRWRPFGDIVAPLIFFCTPRNLGDRRRADSLRIVNLCQNRFAITGLILVGQRQNRRRQGYHSWPSVLGLCNKSTKNVIR